MFSGSADAKGEKLLVRPQVCVAVCLVVTSTHALFVKCHRRIVGPPSTQISTSPITFVTVMSKIEALGRSNGVASNGAGFSIGVIRTAAVFVVSVKAREASGVPVCAGTTADTADDAIATT